MGHLDKATIIDPINMFVYVYGLDFCDMQY